MPTPLLSRRTALGGVAATALLSSGCTFSGVDRRPKAGATLTPPPTRARGTDPDVALAAAVLADEQGLLDRVAATLAKHPRLESLLAAARDAHQAHVDLLTDAVPDDARVTPSDAATPDPSAPPVSPSVSPSADPSPTGPPTVAKRPGPALTALADAEDRLALVARRAAFAAESGAFARVLASMGASASQHSVSLAAAAKERR